MDTLRPARRRGQSLAMARSSQPESSPRGGALGGDLLLQFPPRPACGRHCARPADTGSCVVVLQRALIAKGYSVGSARLRKGHLGAEPGAASGPASTAMSAWGVDAIVGPRTWRAAGDRG